MKETNPNRKYYYLVATFVGFKRCTRTLNLLLCFDNIISTISKLVSFLLACSLTQEANSIIIQKRFQNKLLKEVCTKLVRKLYEEKFSIITTNFSLGTPQAETENPLLTLRVP